jgi:hypothetical protein
MTDYGTAAAVEPLVASLDNTESRSHKAKGQLLSTGGSMRRCV